MNLWIYEKVAKDTSLEVEPKVYTHVDGEAVIDLYRKEDLLPLATLRINKASALVLLAALAGMSGCTGMGSLCDEARVDLQYSHVSHPTVGWPSGGKGDEDTLDTLGPIGRCTHGRTYVEVGLGYKLRDQGFYGPEMTGQMNIGVNIWNSSQ